MNIFKRWLTGMVKKEMTNQFHSAILGNMNIGAAWMPTNADSLINKGYAYNATVYSIVNLVVNACTRIPWQLYEVKEEKALTKYKTATFDNPTMKQAFKTKALEEVNDTRIDEIWRRPNPNQSGTEFVAQNIGFKLTTGNSYAYGIGPDTGVNKGQFQELWNIPSQLMRVKVDGIAKPILGYTSILDQNIMIAPEEIMHRKYWTPLYANGNFAYGLSPIQAGSKVLTRSNDGYTSSVAMFQNNGARGMITTNVGPGVPALTQEQAAALKEKLREEHGGPSNAGVDLVTGANLKWQQMGMSPVDLAILESEKMDTRTLCSLYGVQSQLLNDPDNKTYANQRDAYRALFLNAAIPEMEDLRDELNRWWIPAFGDNLYFDFDASAIAELQDDMQKMTANMAAAWWLTPNEKRGSMMFDSSEEQGMDQVWIPTGLMPINENIITGEDL